MSFTYNVTVSPDSPELPVNPLVKKAVVGMMTFPFRIITFPFKMIIFPFEMIARIFHEMGEVCGPKPLNYAIGMPFYMMEGMMYFIIFPFKIITFPFDVIIAGLDEAANEGT